MSTIAHHGGASGSGVHSSSAQRVSNYCGWCVAALLLVAIPYRVWSDGYLNHVSGSWAALADDVAHGVLYRPVLSELGYGGTRNFPLHFIFHGALAWLGLSLWSAGHLVSLGAAALVVLGGYFGLSRHGAAPRTAVALALLALASRTAVMGVAGIRGDLLPVALGVLGLGLMPTASRGALLPAALALSLSVLAKPTLVWAPGGALLALVFARRFAHAIKLAALVGAFTTGGLLLTIWLSHGEMLRSFKACASGGGFSLATLAAELPYVRPGDAAWILGGVFVSLYAGRKALVHPFAAASLLCLPVTLFIFTSKGTHVNHLVDACVIGALAIGVAVADASNQQRWLPILVGLATALGCVEVIVLDGTSLHHGELDRAARALPKGAAPVLAEQPWVPLLAGERPFLLDAYNLNLTRKTSAQIDRDLLDSIDRKRFRAVVLLGRPDKYTYWYDSVSFGEGFKEHLLAAYSFRGIHGSQAFYLPRGSEEDEKGLPEGESETFLERIERPGGVRALLRRLRGR